MNNLSKLLLCMLCIVLCTSLPAQQDKIDSLRAGISKESDPLHRTDLLNKLASNFQRISADSSLFYAREALALSEVSNYTIGKIEALVELAIANTNIGNFEEAKTFGKEGLSLASGLGDHKKALSLSSNIGRAYARQGSFHGALFYFKQALEFSDSLTSPNAMANLYNSIGTVYSLLKEYELATEHYEKALDSYGEEPDQRSLSMLYNNIGGSYAYQKAWDKALSYYEKALEINEQLPFPCLVYSQVYNIGEIHLELGALDKASEYLERTRELSKDCENSVVNGYLLFNLGKLEAAKGNDRKAIQYFDQAMSWINNQQSFSDIDQITKDIYQFYRDRGMTTKALEYLERHTRAKDSVSELADIQKIALLTSEYEFEKERDQLKAEQARAELQLQNDLTRQRLFKNMLFTTAVFFILIALLYYRSAKHRSTINLQLAEQNQLVNAQKQALIEKTDELTRTNEMINKLHEFKESLTHMIAHDLKNALNSILALSGKPRDREMEIIHQNGGQALGLINNMLDVYKFEDAAMNLKVEQCSFNEILKSASTQVFFLLEFKRLKLVAELEHDIVLEIDRGIITRVLINLLTNAIKYSAPGSEIFLRASFHEKGSEQPQILIELEDLGEGIAQEDVPYIFDKYWQSKARNIRKDISTGLGLTFCKMAVEAHKGIIDVKSVLNQGTTFFFYLPALRKEALVDPCYNPPENHEEQENSRQSALKIYALKFSGIKVHEVSRIKKLLKEIENKNLETDWSRQVEMAMYHGNQALFDELTASFLA